MDRETLEGKQGLWNEDEKAVLETKAGADQPSRGGKDAVSPRSPLPADPSPPKQDAREGAEHAGGASALGLAPHTGPSSLETTLSAARTPIHYLGFQSPGET